MELEVNGLAALQRRCVVKVCDPRSLLPTSPPCMSLKRSLPHNRVPAPHKVLVSPGTPQSNSETSKQVRDRIRQGADLIMLY